MSRIADVKQAATALEAYFLRRVLAEVRTSENSLASGGLAGDMFKEMFDEAVADKMAAAGGVGLAKVISRQLDPSGAKAKPAPAASAPVDGATAGIMLGGGAAAAPAAPSPGPAARPAMPILRGGVNIRPYHSAA